MTWIFCKNGVAKYYPAFNVHNYLQSNSFVFNSSCDWRSCLSETFCSSDRSSAQTFMSKYIKQLRGKQNFQFLDKDLRLYFDKIDAKFIWLFPKNVCRLFFDCLTIEKKLNRNWTKILLKYIGSLQPMCFDFTRHSLKKFVYEHFLHNSRIIP